MNGNNIPASYLEKFQREMREYFEAIGVKQKPSHDELPPELRAFMLELD